MYTCVCMHVYMNMYNELAHHPLHIWGKNSAARSYIAATNTTAPPLCQQAKAVRSRHGYTPGIRIFYVSSICMTLFRMKLPTTLAPRECKQPNNALENMEAEPTRTSP